MKYNKIPGLKRGLNEKNTAKKKKKKKKKKPNEYKAIISLKIKE